MDNTNLVYNEEKKYIFSLNNKDWDLEDNTKDSMEIFKQNDELQTKIELKYFKYGMQEIQKPNFEMENTRYRHDNNLHFLTNHLNKKLNKLEKLVTAADNCKKNLITGVPYVQFTQSLYDIQFHNIEIILWLKIYVDTLILYLTKDEYESTEKDELFKKYKIKKTEHIKQLLDIITKGSNNFKHHSRVQKLTHVPLDCAKAPVILLELSARKASNSSNEYITQPIYELIKGVNIFTYRIIVALNKALASNTAE